LTRKISKEKTKERIFYLREKLKLWSQKYHHLSTSEVSDQVYDAHYQELLELEKKHPELIDSDSETQKVGSQTISENLRKIPHSVPMLSLENIFNQEDLSKWLKRINKQINDCDSLSSLMKFPEIVCEYKIDGLSISIFYQNGKIQRALTRGNGSIGEDVTRNVKTINTLPQEIDFTEKLEVRGEIFMAFSVFKDFSQFANPRNAASGSLKLLDSSICAQRKLDLFIFEALFFKAEKLVQRFQKHSENLEFLKNLGFPVNPENFLAESPQTIEQCYQNFKKKKTSLDYGVDGMVLKLNNLAFRTKLKENNKYPRWAAAYKFSSEKTESQITQITCEVGRSGAVTPVASVLPVSLAGSIVKRASLHNFDFIKRLDIREGDFVWLHKAGDIIPEVLSVNRAKRSPENQEFIVPETCPSCQSKLSKENLQEVAIKCLNPDCPAQIQKKLEYWCSKDALDIKGLGESLIKLLLNKNLIKTIPDLYRLENKREELLSLKRLQEKSVNNLLEALEKSKKTELSRFLTALGIKYLGANLAKLLSRNFKDLEAIQKSSNEDFEQLEGIGSNIAKEINSYFKEAKNTSLIKELITLGFQIVNSDFLRDRQKIKKEKLFLITGSFEQSREAIKRKIELSGHKVTSSLTKKTDYLLCGQKPGSKLKKAEDIGVKIIRELENLDEILLEENQLIL